MTQAELTAAKFSAGLKEIIAKDNFTPIQQLFERATQQAVAEAVLQVPDSNDSEQQKEDIRRVLAGA